MDHLVDLANSYFHEPYASLFNGMVLGRKLETTKLFYDQLKAVGLLHLVVLSGSNIAILIAILMNTFVRFIHRKVATIVTIGSVGGFVLFVGAEPPIVRAAIMGCFSLIALLWGRKTLAIYLLFLSGFVMLIINKNWLTSLSFQLSFSATLGIILFASPAIEAEDGKKNLKDLNKVQKLWQYIHEEFRISISAQIFVLPIIFIYFREISLVSPLANVLVAWTAAPIIILGILTFVLGSFSWRLGFIFSWLAYPLLYWIGFVTEILSQIPGGFLKF